MKCNKCAAPFASSEQMAISRCDHVFCIKCAKEMVHAGEDCTVCGSSVTKSSFKVAVYERDFEDAKHILCGQNPEFILRSCASAMHFYQEQSKIDVARLAQDEIERIQQTVRSKLSEVHGAYKRYKARCTEFAEEQASMARDRNELQEKYAQKTAQARRLQEICEKLQNENKRLQKVQGAPYFDARPQASEDSRGRVNRQRLTPSVPASARKRSSYQTERHPSKQVRAPFLTARSHVSEESHGHMKRKTAVTGVSARRRGSYQPEVYPKERAAASEVNSFHTAPRATLSTGFRASKRKLFEIAQNPGDRQWDQQWSVDPQRSSQMKATAPEQQKDPFEIDTPIGFLS